MQPAIAVKALVSGDIDYLMAWGSAVDRSIVTGVRSKPSSAWQHGRCMCSLPGRG